MPANGLETRPRIEVSAPTAFGFTAMLAMHGCGLLLVLPVLACVVVMSLMPIGFLPLALPLVGVFISALFLPLGFGNPYVKHLVKRRVGGHAERADSFVVQATLTPRLRGGLRGMFEDADDIGLLRIGDSEVSFAGDSLHLSIPFDRIQSVALRNVGMRGLFVYGQRLEITFAGGRDFRVVEFAERSSLLLPNSRRITRRMRELLEQKISEARR